MSYFQRLRDFGTHRGCSCPSARLEAPQGLCAHRVAVGLLRRALGRLQPNQSATPAPGIAPQSAEPAPRPCAAGAASAMTVHACHPEGWHIELPLESLAAVETAVAELKQRR